MNCIVLAHGGAAETVARHTPNWEAAFDGLTFISPSDDPLPGSLPIGVSCRNGVGSIERLIFAMAMASRFLECVILEYDCLVFTRDLKRNDEIQRWAFGPWASWELLSLAHRNHSDLLCSETFPNEDPPHIFAGKTYGHAPWIATGETWWKLLTTGSDLQRGYPDRWLANAAQRANVSLRGMEGAYSRDRDFDAVAARMARLRGAAAIHGCKTKEQYECIMSDQEPMQGSSGIMTGTIDTTGIETTVIYEDEQYRRTSCPACDGQGCDRCIPSEFRTEGV